MAWGPTPSPQIFAPDTECVILLAHASDLAGLQHSRILTRQTDARNPLAADLRYAAMRYGRSYRRPQREREREKDENVENS